MKVKNSLCSCRSVASMKKRSLSLYERAESMSSEKEIKKLNQWDHEHVEKTNPTLLYNTILSANFKIPSKTEKILKFAHETATNSKISFNLKPLIMTKSQSTKKLNEVLNQLTAPKMKMKLSSFDFQTFDKKRNAFSQPKDVIGNEMYSNILKEKIKNENFHRNELMEISNQITIKKIEKEKYQTILNELYTVLHKAKNEHDLQVDMLKEQIKTINNHFSHFQKSISNFLSTSPKKEKQKRMSVIATSPSQFKPQMRGSKIIPHAISDAKMRKIIQARAKINSIENCIEDYHNNYNKIKEEYESLIENCTNTLTSIQAIEQYLKSVFNTISHDQITYYSAMLKEGIDTRKEGLSWIVRKLIELNVNIDYPMFPLFLSHEQIDYIIAISNKLIERSALILMLKIYRKKQQQLNEEDNIKKIRRMSQYANGKSDAGSLVKEMFDKDIFSKKILHKFEAIYLKYESLMKLTLEKKMEIVHMDKIVKGIKAELIKEMTQKKKGSVSVDESNTNEINVLEVIMKNDKQKEYYEYLLKIRNRLKEIDNEIRVIYKSEFDKFNSQYKYKTKCETVKDEKDNLMYNRVYKALFGTMLPL